MFFEACGLVGLRRSICISYLRDRHKKEAPRSRTSNENDTQPTQSTTMVVVLGAGSKGFPKRKSHTKPAIEAAANQVLSIKCLFNRLSLLQPVFDREREFFGYLKKLSPSQTASAVVLTTVRSAKDDCICRTPGRRDRCWRWMRAKSSVSSAMILMR